MNAPRRPAVQIGCAILLIAAVAFPAGIWLARTSQAPLAGAPAPSRAPARAKAVARNPYSANIRDDPYVLERQRGLVEAMERGCARSGAGCAEARQARRYIDAREAE